MKFKRGIFILLSFFIPFFSNGQSFIGFPESNYAGIIGASEQPASIVDNPYKFELCLLGVSAFAENNIASLYTDQPFMNPYSRDKYKRDLSTKAKYLYLDSEIRLPSAMYSLSKKHAVGISTGIKTMANFDDIYAPLAHTAFTINNGSFDEQAQLELLQQPLAFKLNAMSWRELGLTYARVLSKSNEQFVKAGVTFKYIKGNGAAFGFFESEGLKIDTPNFRIADTLTMGYGISDNLGGLMRGDAYKVGSKGTFGLDIGIVTEFRNRTSVTPAFRNKIYTRKELKRNDRPYKLRLGASLIDIGRIKYRYDSANISASNLLLDSIINPLDSTVNLVNFRDKFNVSSVNELNDSLATILTVDPNTGKFTFGLPTRLNLNADYHIRKGYYMNFNATVSLAALKFSDYKVHKITYFTLTPRWENDFSSAFAPIYLNTKGQVNVGLGFRLGPLVVGVNDVLPLLTRKKMESQGAYVALKTFIIPRKPKSPLDCQGVWDGWIRNKKKGRKN